MGKIRGLDGSLIGSEAPANTIVVDAESYLNLIARVQNLEALSIMTMSICQRMLPPDDSHELDVVMEAFFQAQVQRGARHLVREDDNPDVFV